MGLARTSWAIGEDSAVVAFEHARNCGQHRFEDFLLACIRAKDPVKLVKLLVPLGTFCSRWFSSVDPGQPAHSEMGGLENGY